MGESSPAKHINRQQELAPTKIDMIGCVGVLVAKMGTEHERTEPYKFVARFFFAKTSVNNSHISDKYIATHINY